MSGLVETGGVAAPAATAAVLLAALWIAWLEARRPRARRALRVALSAVALAALWVLAAAPLRTVEIGPAPVLLRTDGWPGVDEAPAPDRVTFTLAGVEGGAPGRRRDPDRVLPDVAALPRQAPPIASLAVSGHGLPAWEWTRLATPLAAFRAPPLEAGIARVGWRRRLRLGESLVVRGATTEAGTVVLSGPAGPVAREVLEAPGGFELVERPRRAGRALYRLRFEPLGASGEASEGALDVEILPPMPPRLLWLEGAPSFEMPRVKAWYRDLPGTMVVRTEISRDRIRTEAVNREPLRADRVTPALLAEADLVVADPAALAGLDRGERAALLRAVETDGLGLLLRAGPGLERVLGEPPFEGFAVRAVPGSRSAGGSGEMIVRLDAGLVETEPLPVEPRELGGEAVRPLVRDRAGRVHAAFLPRGAGRVGVALPAGTYRWVLEGRASSHRAYWTPLLGALARPDGAPRWSWREGPVFVDEPLALALAPAGEARQARVETPAGAAWRLPLTDSDRGAGRVAVVWPGEAGWYRLAGGGAEAWFYAQEQTSWRVWRQHRAQQATRARAVGWPADPAAVAGSRSSGPRVASRSERRPVSPLAAWGVLLAALAGLWAEERLPGPASKRPGDTP